MEKNEIKRKNTATEVFKKTLGQHEVLKSHEEAVQKKKEKQEKAAFITGDCIAIDGGRACLGAR